MKQEQGRGVAAGETRGAHAELALGLDREAVDRAFDLHRRVDVEVA